MKEGLYVMQIEFICATNKECTPKKLNLFCIRLVINVLELIFLQNYLRYYNRVSTSVKKFNLTRSV